jgi:hypothetical protein
MKNLIVAALASVSFSATAAAPNFSAFAQDDKLIVTIMGDACNGFGGQLDVEGLCKADRLTRNFAIECSGTLSVISTAMMCLEKKPVTLELSLKAAKVAPEARVLHLTYGNQTIDVQLK